MLGSFRVVRAATRHLKAVAGTRRQAARNMFAGPGSDLLAQQSLCAGSCQRAERLEDAKITELAAAVPAWQVSETRDKVTRAFVARNFAAAMDFFNKVAAIAEAEGHHPDLHLTGYRNVEVVLSTHSLGALSLGDFVVAAKIDQLEVDYSPKWLREQQQLLQKQ